MFDLSSTSLPRGTEGSNPSSSGDESGSGAQRRRCTSPGRLLRSCSNCR